MAGLEGGDVTHHPEAREGLLLGAGLDRDELKPFAAFFGLRQLPSDGLSREDDADGHDAPTRAHVRLPNETDAVHSRVPSAGARVAKYIL